MKVANWREQILMEFTPGAARITLVADPDGLLLEELIQAAIRGKGFELVTFEDSAAFRFVHESAYRSRWDQGEATDDEVVIRVATDDLTVLPYDLLQARRRLAFGLGELFAGLSYPVVASLDRSDLDALYGALERTNPGRLGDASTKDFVLLHVFGIAPALVKHSAELLRALLRRHYRRQILPCSLDERLVRVLRQNKTFDAWPLETIVPNREAFFSFLQERWPLFLDRLAAQLATSIEDKDRNAFQEPECPSDLPFDHDDVRVYVDNLFIEGLLRPVRHRHGSALADEWASVGIRIDPIADRLRRIKGLVETVSAAIPDPETRHHDWSSFAWRWAELAIVWSEIDAGARAESESQVNELRAEVDRAFLSWMEHRYAGLHNQPPDPPAMLHHVPRFLCRRLADAPGSKVALIVVDGLALDQWIVLRDVLATQQPQFRFHEDVVFAWVPTITSVSRQSIFAGAPPLFFPSSILTTHREQSLWTRFWMDQGLAAREAGYAKGLGDGVFNDIPESLSQPGVRALGLVVDKVDKIMHGMELGTAGMHNQVRQWATEGFMAKLLDMLFDRGFAVFLTSDHGNIEAQGCGRPSEGAMADLRGERVRIYPDPILRSRVKKSFPNAVEWPALGLPENCLTLLAPDRSAFIREGERIVGHGGISLEEVIVPMVRIERAAT